MKPKAAHACCSLFKKARRGKWKLSSSWAAKRWLWLPYRVNTIPSFLFLRVWTSICMAVLELSCTPPPFLLPGRLTWRGPHLQQIFCGPQSQVGLDCGVLWAQIWLIREVKVLMSLFPPRKSPGACMSISWPLLLPGKLAKLLLLLICC